MNMSVQVRYARVNRHGHAGPMDLGGMRKLLTNCNHIYFDIMLITAFIFFTVLDGKNQLLLALLKCTGKGFSFFTKNNILKKSLRQGFSIFIFSFVHPSFPDRREPPPLYSFLLWWEHAANKIYCTTFLSPWTFHHSKQSRHTGITAKSKDLKCARRTQICWGHQEPVTTHQTLCLQSKGQVFL